MNFCCIHLPLSDFDHLCLYDKKLANCIIALSGNYKINNIHKIIKSDTQKCTLDISCFQLFENKEIIDN